MKNAILIAGPTASGKSSLAMRLAARDGGVIVNTDAMQVYSTLKILTARPSAADMAQAPHVLYGHVAPRISYSVGAWQREVADLAAQGMFDTARPIFAGGTGLYFRALTEGLSHMPDIPQPVRDRWRHQLLEDGPERLHRLLMREDPETAMQLSAGDGQRIVRALEVMDASGRSIRDWQRQAGRPLVDRASARFYVIEPDRGELVARIERRFDAMVSAGAMDEARSVVALRLDPALPAAKAIGLRELAAVADGAMQLSDAIERAKAATRQYAKRQSTWFRNQFGREWTRLDLDFRPLSAERTGPL